MNLEVLLGAVVMLVGVMVGFVFMLVALNKASSPVRFSKSDQELIKSLNHQKVMTTPNHTFEGHTYPNIKEKLNQAHNLLLEHNGTISEEVGDRLEELIREANTLLEN